MIFYFSGTGNSEWAAKVIAQYTDERLIKIKPVYNCQASYTLQPKERLGFIFPVHSWGPPKIMLQFIKHMNLQGYQNQYSYFIATCGDDAGCTEDILRKALHNRGIRIDAGFSLQMPNTYIALPGFNVDSHDITQDKLRKAELLIQKIGASVANRDSLFKVHRGSMCHFKSYAIRPLFNRFLINDKFFRHTDSCIGCGLCARICPTGNIVLQNKFPAWKGQCTQCLACYHICPKQAIRILNGHNKGQYLHPDLK